MNTFEIILVAFSMIMPFVVMKMIIDRKKEVKKNLYMLILKILILIVAEIFILSFINVSFGLKSAIITYSAYCSTIYVGLLFQKAYFKYSDILDEKTKDYINKKEGK